ncbi:type 4a pilus biogenesis protein PilO [Actinoplanes aureus]|uniref:Type 4a pilus biogenesis protein PilO n=1 Tax=Actinoplanes aureus TaxID=2792083 RepID=A0A931C482_9ACTN|nr:type 4a pilus biogenesis protein PilO [Actinoplanes aureus]MBG0563094.1 type 4a pilus biogenesis protein PilO [Actinoplanes aureus]
MTARRIDQIWLFGGLALIALLIAGGWFMLISPKYADEAKAQADTQDTTIQLNKAKNGFRALKDETAKLDEYTEQLAEYQAALPVASKTNGIPDFLKQLQTMGTKLDVEVSGYSASAEEDSKDLTTITALPITLNVEGDVERVSKFIKQLQTTQPRAVLIDSGNLAIDDEDRATLSLSLNAYVTSTETEDIS